MKIKKVRKLYTYYITNFNYLKVKITPSNIEWLSTNLKTEN